MIIDESIKFAIDEYLYRNNLSKENLASSIGIHKTLIDRWLNGSVSVISPEIWIPLFPYIEPYIKNPNVIIATKNDLHEYNNSKCKLQNLKKIISEMSYEEACEKLVDSLSFISKKHRLNKNSVSFSEDIYEDIIRGVLIPSVEQIQELCKAWNLNIKTSKVLIDLTDRANSEVVSELSNIICGRNTPNHSCNANRDEEHTLKFVSEIIEKNREDKIVNFE